MKPLRWGILGASNFARKHMAPAIHAAKGAELVGLATSSMENAEEKAAGFRAFAPQIKLYDGYDANSRFKMILLIESYRFLV